MMTKDTKDDLRQADLSHLSLKDMTPEQRAEMRRRYESFVKSFRPGTDAPKRPQNIRKWVPGMKQ